ncbi:MAG: hypothetical protein NE330_01105, partial [Lentisphaeraceae bacterium]|nr:hypothetical protein [Lentisphaeraceae bacterium]
MKTFKHLFLITSLLLFGGFLLASDTGKGGTETEDAKKVDPSNPPECETWECDIPPVKNSDGKVNLIRLACNEDLPNINKPDVMPDIIDGQAYCVEKPEITKDITVSYTWKLEGEFKKGVPGLQQLKLIGTATLSSRECSVSDSDFDVELDVNVITEGMFLALPNKLINCDEVNFFVIGGTPKFTFKVEPNIADIKGNARNGFTIQANGSGLGKATVTVTDKNGCEDVAEIDVAACDFIEPSILAGAHYVGLECVTNVPGREPFNCQMYEAVWDVGDGIEATCKDGEVVKTPIELNKGQIGPRFGKIFKWEVFGATIIGADDQKFVTIENCDENTIISVTISEKYEACEEIHTASDEAIRAGRDSSKKVGLKGAGGQEPNYFNPSNKYASVNLHGKPSSIISPQSETEKDTTRAGFSVDTYNLSPSFSAVDVSIPLQGTDLRLEMKRTNSFDVTNPNQDGNTDNLPGKTILGRTWRTNIAPMVYLKESTRVKNLKLTPVPPCSPELDQPKPGNQSKSIIVHDENGSTFRYNHATLEPEKQSFGDPESALHKLEETPTGYIFTKKNGTVLIFDFLDLNLPETERLGSFADFKVSVSKFARAKSVTDRNGNTLIYEYPLDTVTALPERIYYEQNNKISLKFGYDPSRTKLLNVTDPLNKVTSYEYENDFLHKVIRPEVEIFDPLTKSTSFHSPETVYDYTSIAYKSGNQKLDSVNHAISSITDPEGNVISLTYDTKAIGGQEPLRFTGALVQSPGGGQIFASALEDPQSEVIVTVSTLTSPDGVVEFSLESATDLDRKTVVKDTSGYRWIYNFTVTENDFTVKEGPPLVGGGISLLIGGGEKLLDKFTRTVVDHDSKIKTMTAKFGTNEAHTINLKEVVDYYGNITKYEYGIQPVTFFRTNKDTGEVTKVTEDYDFGRFNQPFREIRDATPIDGDPNDHLNITQEFGYEPKYNQMVRIVDELGNVTTYNIDNEGNRLQAIAPNDKVTTFTYEKGYQTSATDADGRKTVSHRIYDETGWTDTSTIKGYNNELSITTVKQYDLVGNLKQITDGNGNTTKHYYDDTHMLEKTELPPVEDFDSEEAILQRPTINFKRDKNRQIVGKQDARGNWTLTEYDDMLRPETVTIEVAANEAENISTTTIYDEGGNKSIFTDAIGTVYKFEYDVFNNLIKEIKDFGNGEEFQNLISTFEYGENSGSDLFGSSNFAPTKKVDPEGLSSVLEYDNVYRLVSTKAGYQFREQLLSEIVYNNVGNVVKTTTYNDRVSNLDGEYEFDSQSITLGNRETITLYDDLNRKTATAIDLDGDGASIEDPDDIVTNFFYDLSGNIVIVVDPEGHVTQTEYDGAGRVVKEVVNLDDEPQYEEVNGNQHTIIPQEDDIVTTKSYDNNNNILTVTLINDTEGASGTQTITNTYDALNRIKAVKDPEGYSTEKKYDLNNNIRYVKNSRGVETE